MRNYKTFIRCGVALENLDLWSQQLLKKILATCYLLNPNLCSYNQSMLKIWQIKILIIIFGLKVLYFILLI